MRPTWLLTALGVSAWPGAALAQSGDAPNAAPTVVAPPTVTPAIASEPAAASQPPPPPPPEDERDAWELHPAAAALLMGVGTPVGALGVVGEYSVIPRVSLGVGAGVGSGPPGSSLLHGALLAHARPAQGKENAFVLGAAYSYGTYEHRDLVILGNPPSYHALNAQWAQADLGWEHRGKDGIILGVTIGAAWLLNPSALACTPAAPNGDGWFSSPEPCRVVAGQTLLTLGFSLGYAF